MTTVYLNRTHPAMEAVVTIDDEDGSATVDVSNPDTDDLLVLLASSPQPGGYVEPWLSPLAVLQLWAAFMDIGVEVEDEPELWPPLPPGVVA